MNKSRKWKKVKQYNGNNTKRQQKNSPKNTTQKTNKLPIHCTETHENPEG